MRTVLHRMSCHSSNLDTWFPAGDPESQAGAAMLDRNGVSGNWPRIGLVGGASTEPRLSRNFAWFNRIWLAGGKFSYAA
jgi:hypothetical protein